MPTPKHIHKQVNIHTNYGHIHLSAEQAQLQLQQIRAASLIASKDANFVENTTWSAEAMPIRLDQLYIERSIEQDIKNKIEADKSGQVLIVSGEAGYGKTSLLWSLYTNYQNKPDYESWFIKSGQLEQLNLPLAVHTLKAELAQPLIFIDTIDVLLHDEKQRDILVQNLLMLKELEVTVIATCRVREMNLLQEFKGVLQFENMALRLYDLEEELPRAIQSYVNVYCKFNKTWKEEEYLAHILNAVVKGESVRDVCINPLTLRMLFTIYAPEEIRGEINVFQLYKLFWENRVQKDGRAGVHSPSRQASQNTNLEKIACVISLLMLAEGKPEISLTLIKDWLSQMAIRAEDLDVLATRGIVKIAGMNENNHLIDSSLRFFHQTFLEHSAAQAFLLFFKTSSIKLLGQKVMVGTDTNMVNDLFLMPVYEHLLLLTQWRKHKSHPAILQLLQSPVFTERQSGIYVYALLQISTSQLEQAFIRHLTKSETPDINQFLNYASNISGQRKQHLFETLHVIWNRESWQEQQKIITLLERFATTQAEAVLQFWQSQTIIDATLKSSYRRGKQQHQPVFSDVVSLLIKLSLHYPKEALSYLLELYHAVQRAGFRSRVIEQLYHYRANFKEEDLLEQLRSNTRKIKSQANKEFDAELVKAFAAFWSAAWTQTKPPIQTIIEQQLAEDEQSLYFQSLLKAIGHYAQNLDDQNAAVLFQHFKSLNKPIIFKWARFFAVEILNFEDEHQHSSIYQLLLEDIQKVIKQWFLEDYRPPDKEKAKMWFEVYAEVLKKAEFYKKGLSKLLKEEVFYTTQLWQKVLITNECPYQCINLFLDGILAKHEGIVSIVKNFPTEFFQQNYDFTNRMTGYFRARGVAAIFANDLYFNCLLAIKHTAKLTDYLKEIIHYKEGLIPDFVINKKEELITLKEELLLSYKGEHRHLGAHLWYKLVRLELDADFHFSLVIDRLFHDDNLEARSWFLDILAYRMPSTKEDYHLVLNALNKLLDYRVAKLRHKAQNAYMRVLLKSNFPITDTDKAIKVLFMDFNFDYHAEKIKLAPNLIEYWLEKDVALAIELFCQFITSKEVNQLSSKQSKKLARVFNRCTILLFKHADKEQRLGLVHLLPQIDATLSRQLIYAIFYTRTIYLSVEATLNELIVQDLIKDEVKDLINRHRDSKVRLIGNSGWSELYDLLEKVT